jgi:hypothetical protein
VGLGYLSVGVICVRHSRRYYSAVNMSEGEENDLRKNLLGDLQTFFEGKFSELKMDLKIESEWAAESARKKVRLDNSVLIKKAGNKIQFDFNNEILDSLDCVEKAISYRDANKAKEALAEIKEKINHRNKLIRIADSSQGGWATISEYELCDVASDSDDDRRIRKAEERALSKLEKSRNYETANFSSANQPFRRNQGPRGSQRGHMAPGRFLQRGEVVCFKCGALGHFASVCAAEFSGNGAVGTQGGSRGGFARPVESPANPHSSESTKQEDRN